MPKYPKNAPSSLLHQAINKKAISKIECILDRQYENIEAVDNYGRTPLLLAIEKDFDSGFNLLLERGANVNAFDNSRNTALHYAVRLKHNVRLVETLINKGAHVDAVNSAGETALTMSMLYGWDFNYSCGDIFKLLVERGASLNGTNRNGDTPLHYVLCHVPQDIDSDYFGEENVFYTNEFMLHVISLCPSYINQENHDHKTPLHLAIKFGVDVVIIRALLEIGVRSDVANTPLNMVTEGTSIQVIRELIAWGVRVDNTRLYPECNVLLECERYDIMCQPIKLDSSAYAFYCESSNGEMFKKECQKEIEKMKSMKFKNYSVYSLFLHSSDPPLSLVMNKELENIIEVHPCKSEFPIYSAILYKTFREMKGRPRLLDKAEHDMDFPLPPEVRRKILSLLNNGDLENVINACNKTTSKLHTKQRRRRN